MINLVSKRLLDIRLAFWRRVPEPQEYLVVSEYLASETVSTNSPSTEQANVLELIIIKSAIDTLGIHAGKKDIFGRNDESDTWIRNEKISMKIDLMGKIFYWNYFSKIDENLKAPITRINFFHYIIYCDDWACEHKYWEVNPNMIFDIHTNTQYNQETINYRKDYLRQVRKFVSFSGDWDSFENDIILAKMALDK